MTSFTNSFLRRPSLVHLILIIIVLALPVLAQTRSVPDPFQKIALKTTKTCTVGPVGELTSLVKNGVELSVNEDFDCDGAIKASVPGLVHNSHPPPGKLRQEFVMSESARWTA